MKCHDNNNHGNQSNRENGHHGHGKQLNSSISFSVLRKVQLLTQQFT